MDGKGKEMLMRFDRQQGNQKKPHTPGMASEPKVGDHCEERRGH